MNPKAGAPAELEPEDVDSSDLVKTGRHIVIGIPGAFTKVCASKHLPGFIEELETQGGNFKRFGCDSVILVSPNDAFVVEAWAKALPGLKQITLVADGNVALSSALGLSWDASEKGMGTRSKRFVALVQDGIVCKVFVEDEPNDLRLTDVHYVLDQIKALPQGCTSWVDGFAGSAGGSGKAGATASSTSAAGIEGSRY